MRETMFQSVFHKPVNVVLAVNHGYTQILSIEYPSFGRNEVIILSNGFDAIVTVSLSYEG
jgi:hypothetical protein